MDTLKGKKIVDYKNDKKKIVLKLDDGSELVIEEGSGPGLDHNLYTFPTIRLQKEGKVIARDNL